MPCQAGLKAERPICNCNSTRYSWARPLSHIKHSVSPRQGWAQDLLGRDRDQDRDLSSRDRDKTETFAKLSETRPRRDPRVSETRPRRRPFSGRDYIETHGLYMHGICTSHCVSKKKSLRLG